MATRPQEPITPQDIAPARLLLGTLSPELRAIGAEWWDVVGDRCARWARETDHSLPQAAAVLALYSPNRTWPGNVTLAKRALYTGTINGTPDQTAKIRAVLAISAAQATPQALDTHVRGPKVRNMYGSILGQDCCCIDLHLYAIWHRRPSTSSYAWVEARIRTLASEIGLTARATQAILWLAKVAHDGRRLDLYHPRKDTPSP